MTAEQAREKAMDIVLFAYNRGDIEEECKRRGIKVIKNRSAMEHKLVESMTKEFITEP